MTDNVRLKSNLEVYSDPFLKVEERLYEHEGRPYRYRIKLEPEFAVVGAVTEEGQILLVRQFRPGPGRFTFDLPGGMVDAGDTAAETARKELLEETGYEAGRLEAVTTAYVTAYSTARKHIFLAYDCRKVGEPEEDENVIGAPVLVTPEEFVPLLRSGHLLDLDAAMLLAATLGLRL